MFVHYFLLLGENRQNHTFWRKSSITSFRQ